MTEVSAAEWPVLMSGEELQCVAMFIDIRGSSASGSRIGIGYSFPTRLSAEFTRETGAFWRGFDAPQPSNIRLSGDGIFCTWEYNRQLGGFEYHDDRERIIKAAIDLLPYLRERLQPLAHVEDGLRFGIGLAHGAVGRANIRTSLYELSDYYGHTINLASKLQNLARPFGVVADQDFISSRCAESLKLKGRVFENPITGGELHCLATPEVRPFVNWTCLAWPGFATAANTPNAERMSLHMNGITVLTHEGLQGKIETLEIWPRNDMRERGDTFEVIIDDFDGLCALHDSHQLSLFKRTPMQVEGVAPVLSEMTHDSCEFYFKPIRCGLNAVAWHDDVDQLVAPCSTYGEIIALRPDHPEIMLALYDNLNASMSVLLNAFHPDLDANGIISAGESCWQDVLEKLSALQDLLPSGTKLFRLEPSIFDLASHIQSGNRVTVAIGGGAWLGNPRNDPKDDPIHIGIPAKAKGFIWVEGAAVIHNQDRPIRLNNLRDDLKATVLRDDYQNGLIDGLRYGTVPVTNPALARLLGDAGDEIIADKVAAALTVEEARLMFKKTGKLERPRLRISDRCEIRRRPPKPVGTDWDIAWTRIKELFCSFRN